MCALYIHRTAVKDRIVAFLLFLGKVFIVCVIGKFVTFSQNLCSNSLPPSPSPSPSPSLPPSLSLPLGILAYLGFGPYQDQGEKLWGEPLNYYLLPVIVSVYAIHKIGTVCVEIMLFCYTDSDYSGLFHSVWVHECLPHGSGHHLHLCL